MKKDYDFDLKKEFIKVVLGILLILVIGFIIKYFNFGFYGSYITILITIVVIQLALKEEFKTKKFFINAIILFLLLKLYYWLGSYGWIGFILTIIIILILILYKRWNQYMKVKWHIESKIWGKPLKEFIRDGKPIPKLKLKF